LLRFLSNRGHQFEFVPQPVSELDRCLTISHRTPKQIRSVLFFSPIRVVDCPIDKSVSACGIRLLELHRLIDVRKKERVYRRYIASPPRQNQLAGADENEGPAIPVAAAQNDTGADRAQKCGIK
jgi:hypothetical protein